MSIDFGALKERARFAHGSNGWSVTCEEGEALIEAAEERDKARSLLLHAVDIMCEITFQDRTDGTIISDMMDWANTWRREITGIKPEFWPDATQEKIKAVYGYRKRAETAEAEAERLREALRHAVNLLECTDAEGWLEYLGEGGADTDYKQVVAEARAALERSK